IWELKDLHITHHYQNGFYKYSEIQLMFPDDIEIVTLSSLAESEKFTDTLKMYGRQIDKAKSEGDFDFFIRQDDFRNYAPEANGKRGHLEIKPFAMGYALPFLSATILSLIAFLINVDRPLRPRIYLTPTPALTSSS